MRPCPPWTAPACLGGSAYVPRRIRAAPRRLRAPLPASAAPSRPGAALLMQSLQRFMNLPRAMASPEESRTESRLHNRCTRDPKLESPKPGIRVAQTRNPGRPNPESGRPTSRASCPVGKCELTLLLIDLPLPRSAVSRLRNNVKSPSVQLEHQLLRWLDSNCIINVKSHAVQ